MSEELIKIIRESSQSLEALETGESPRLQRLSSISAVLFDVYGTLMISGSGEVGTAAATDAPSAFRAALETVGLDARRVPPDVGLEPTIRRVHERQRDEGIDYPEVEIREVWRETLRALVDGAQIAANALNCDLGRLAVDYECRVNPVWPMPQAVSCIDAFAGRRILGIVSNAQFFTPLLFPALMMRNLEQLGFSREMQYYSYECGAAKPSPRMFQMSLDRLRTQGILAGETLYVGNDMLNDVSAARQLGMKTALFAGDARSLRWRAADPRVAGHQPDLVITELTQLTECLL